MFAENGIKPWEIDQLTIEQLYQARDAFDAEIEASKQQ